ncbi:MAG: hypothetical protein KC983_03160 [Phycisphaerales bacterium]|nr:hypothetical protein [Phycisphaerales bacterium]
MRPVIHNLPTVQLRHVLHAAEDAPTVRDGTSAADGSWHIDWLLATSDEPTDLLTSYRLPAVLHTLRVGEELACERIADHRPAYLTYEGPISRDRGAVIRVAAGRWRYLDPDPLRLRIEVRWASAGVLQHVLVMPDRVKCEHLASVQADDVAE